MFGRLSPLMLTPGLALAALVGPVSKVNAADIPARIQAPAYPIPAPIFTWTGFYAGANIGYGSRIGDDYRLAVQPGFFPSAPATIGTISSERKGDGAVGGGQVGYNYQIGQFVIGAENDLQYFGLGKRRANYSFNGVGAMPANFNYIGPERSTEWFASGRARIGYAFDRLLVYGTAGLTYANLKSGYCATSNCDKGQIGYAAGAGVEYAITPNISVKVEGLYVNLGKTREGVIGTDATGQIYLGSTRKIDNEAVIGRVGVNYRF